MEPQENTKVPSGEHAEYRGLGMDLAGQFVEGTGTGVGTGLTLWALSHLGGGNDQQQQTPTPSDPPPQVVLPPGVDAD